MGMDVFNHLLAPILPNGQHISDVLGDAFLEAERLTRDGDDVDQDYASIIFAWCESLYRAGMRAIRSSLGKRLSAARNVDEVYDSVPPLMLEDLARLRIVNQRQIKHWRLRMYQGAFFISNPSFSGDFLVGAPTATGSSTIPFSTSRSWTRSAHHGCGKSSCSSWATSSSTSTTLPRQTHRHLATTPSEPLESGR